MKPVTLVHFFWQTPLGVRSTRRRHQSPEMPCLDNSRRCGSPVVHFTSRFCTWWYHLIPNSFRKHHSLRASTSILSTYLLVIGQHSKPSDVTLLLLLLVRHAPLGVRSAKCRHQSPEWIILSHSYRLIQ